MEHIYSCSYNGDVNELTIFEDDFVLATISDVVDSENAIDEIFKDTVYNMRGIEL